MYTEIRPKIDDLKDIKGPDSQELPREVPWSKIVGQLEFLEVPGTEETGALVKGPSKRLRQAFLFEVGQIKSEHGDLEAVRRRLGLSRRKMCEILLVDPSAWTRWTRPGQDAPPHIYKTLSLLLILRGDSNKVLGSSVGIKVGELRSQVEGLMGAIERFKKLEKSVLYLGIILVILIAASFFR